jgi:cytochrome c biogenesis protein CcmG/thiol:disulfide interchange protein DsbE
LLLLVLIMAACSQPTEPAMDDLPLMSPAAFRQKLADLDTPALVNVWAAWCLPCRSEAPLLRAAHQRYGDRIAFIGVDIEDDQQSAKEFLAEFGITFEQVFDRNRDIPADLGGFGVPITYFFAPGGELIHTHSGIIDEQTLALRIDELLQNS